MVHTGEKEPVDEHLDLLRPLAKVLVDPCAAFGGDELRPLHVRGGRGEFRDQDVTIVLAEERRVVRLSVIRSVEKPDK